MKSDIILIGGGGHCISCIEIIESLDEYNIFGILDKKENIGKNILGYKIIGTDDLIPEFCSLKYKFLITVGQIKNSEIRVKLYELLNANNGNMPVIISPDAKVSKYAEIGDGTVVMPGVFINASVKIGKNCIVNTGSIIEHETIIGDNCHISTGTIINGQCNIGKRVFLGSGSVVSNNVEIISDTVIGSGTNIISSIKASGVYGGNPAKKLRI